MRVSKLLATLVVVGAVAITSVAPAYAGTLEQDKAWVEAQAAAGLAAAQANLDAAKATMVTAAADRDAKAAAGLEAAKANLRAAGWNI